VCVAGEQWGIQACWDLRAGVLLEGCGNVSLQLCREGVLVASLLGGKWWTCCAVAPGGKSWSNKKAAGPSWELTAQHICSSSLLSSGSWRAAANRVGRARWPSCQL
jgi:hypothetical protein